MKRGWVHMRIMANNSYYHSTCDIFDPNAEHMRHCNSNITPHEWKNTDTFFLESNVIPNS